MFGIRAKYCNHWIHLAPTLISFLSPCFSSSSPCFRHPPSPSPPAASAAPAATRLLCRPAPLSAPHACLLDNATPVTASVLHRRLRRLALLLLLPPRHLLRRPTAAPTPRFAAPCGCIHAIVGLALSCHRQCQEAFSSLDLPEKSSSISLFNIFILHIPHSVKPVSKINLFRFNKFSLFEQQM